MRTDTQRQVPFVTEGRRLTILSSLHNTDKFSERMRQLPILSGVTVIGCLSTALHPNISDTIQGETKPKSHQRLLALRSLHEYNKLRLKHIATKTHCGHARQSHYDTRILLHQVLPFYVTNTLKTKDLLGTKIKNQSKYPCHECMVAEQMLQFGSHFRKNNFENSQKLMNGGAKESLTVRKFYQYSAEMSFFRLLPVLFNFSFAGMHPTNDIHRMF